LAYAERGGIPVPPGVISRAKPYLVRALADPVGAAKWCTSVECKSSLRLSLLQALAATGDRRTDFLQSIYARREDLGLPERIALALYLQQSPGWRSQAGTLAAELDAEVYVTGRYANVQPENAWSGTSAEAQARYLELLILRRASQQNIDRGFEALVAQSCKCGWSGAQDTAAALEAAVAYASAVDAPANFTAALFIDGKSAGTAHFTGSGQSPQTFTLRDLSAGRHTVALHKTGSGTLHYNVAYTYSLGSHAPGRLAGLRVIREVRPANVQTVIASMDIAAPAQRLSFAAGAAYDIGVRVITDHPVDRVTISDPLPAGFEALDTSFQTTAAYYQPLADAWQIDYQQIYSDRVVAFAQHLDPGVYELHYLARTVTPGEYIWPGTSAYLLNAPEQFGRTAFAEVQITQ
jgi:hypothetical protein